MDNIAYVALSRQQTLRREMDVVATNIANADTNGFKVESLLMETAPVAPAANMDAPNPVNFVRDAGVIRDLSQGVMEQTARPLDLAIEGDAYFMVDTGTRQYAYTRDGSFTMDGDGRLTTSSGHPVLDDQFNPIQLNAAGGTPTIAEDGTIFQGGAQVARIGVFRFPVTRQLQHMGGNLLRPPPNEPPQIAEEARVRQGRLEASNVEPITEITRMMEVQRAYERVTRIVDSTEDLSRRAVERLGAVRG